MRFYRLRRASLILGVSTSLVFIVACEKYGLNRSSDKKSSDTQSAEGQPRGNTPYGYSTGNPAANGNGPIVSTNPNSFNNPYNPLGFPNSPGGLNGFGGDTPLVLDWDRDGKITMATNLVAFDINGDGIRDLTEWVGSEERILAIDLNGNGRIDSAKELFGSGTVDLSSYRMFHNGFQALAAYDSNKDGKIDANDPVFAKLVLWQDRNSNGISDEGELTLVSETAVIALNSLYKTIPMRDGIIKGSRSRIGFESVYETGEGQHLLADVIFFSKRNAADLMAAFTKSEVHE